jgi:hypothetical protein
MLFMKKKLWGKVKINYQPDPIAVKYLMQYIIFTPETQNFIK